MFLGPRIGAVAARAGADGHLFLHVDQQEGGSRRLPGHPAVPMKSALPIPIPLWRRML